MGCNNTKAVPESIPETPKEEAKEAEVVVEFEAHGHLQVFGVYGSMNCMGAVMMSVEEKIGKLVPTMPGSGTRTPEFKKINPFCGVPAIMDPFADAKHVHATNPQTPSGIDIPHYLFMYGSGFDGAN